MNDHMSFNYFSHIFKKESHVIELRISVKNMDSQSKINGWPIGKWGPSCEKTIKSKKVLPACT